MQCRVQAYLAKIPNLYHHFFQSSSDCKHVNILTKFIETCPIFLPLKYINDTMNIHRQIKTINELRRQFFKTKILIPNLNNLLMEVD